MKTLYSPFWRSVQSQIEDLQNLSKQYELQASERMVPNNDGGEAEAGFINRPIEVQQRRRYGPDPHGRNDRWTLVLGCDHLWSSCFQPRLQSEFEAFLSSWHALKGRLEDHGRYTGSILLVNNHQSMRAIEVIKVSTEHFAFSLNPPPGVQASIVEHLSIMNCICLHNIYVSSSKTLWNFLLSFSTFEAFER